MASWSPSVRGRSLRVHVSEVLEDSHAALQHVLAVVPGWDEGAANGAMVEQISGAMTNLVYRCASMAAAANPTVIVRVFGAGGRLFSQRDERSIFLLASQLGLGPACLVEFENGRVEQFLPGDTLTSQLMRHPGVSAGIAAAAARFHVHMLGTLSAPAPAAGEASSGSDGTAAPAPPSAAAGTTSRGTKPAHMGEPAIYERIRQWHAAALVACTQADLTAEGLGSLPEELEALRARVAILPSWLGFCHNDLQYGNILLAGAPPLPRQPDGSADGGASAAPGSQSAAESDGSGGNGVANGGGAAGEQAAQAAALNDGGGSSAANGGGPGVDLVPVKLIDYEYSTVNDVAFDVANHFCEWAYDYHSDEAHVFHDSWLPSQEQQLHFCRTYVAAMRQLAGEVAAAAGPPPKRRATGGADGAFPTASQALPPGCDGAAADLLGRVLAGGGGDAEASAQLLLRKAAAQLPLVHLKWGLWGLIQDKTSDVGFDYLSYGRQRIQRYHTARQAVLAPPQ